MSELLVVTPVHDEEANIDGLVKAISAQTFRDFTWVIVDDGSTDRTPQMLSELSASGVAEILTKTNDGGLIGGSAYTSWRFGVEAALAASSTYTHVMKLDADVRLPPDYFQRVLEAFDSGVGIAGGRIATHGMKEQLVHVPGPVKLYSIRAYLQTRSMPPAIGFDVMDEIASAQVGLRTVVIRDLYFDLSRAIGASEGGIHGRYRNGRVCRWTGYAPAYFVLHALRYLVRRPRAIGTAAMVYGYLTAGKSPYATSLRADHASLQRRKLRAALRNPRRFIRETY